MERLALVVGAAPAFLPQRQYGAVKEGIKEPPPYLARQQELVGAHAVVFAGVRQQLLHKDVLLARLEGQRK